jgi:hypothetical protein
MLVILMALLLLSLMGGGFGFTRFGYGSWSPAAFVVFIIVVMALTGRL